MPKPTTAAGYTGTQVANVRAACLYLATKVGDLLDELVIVGGLVPTLLIDQTGADTERHVGTLDLDVGMQLAILDHKRYAALTERLRAAGFGPDTNENGNETRQRWKIDGPPKVTLDFLIPPSSKSDRGGQLRDLEEDFAAIIAPGLRLAFMDYVKVTLDGRTIRKEQARREIKVCGPAAFIVMKALAFRSRGENKDAYDLVYFLRNFGDGPPTVAAQLEPLAKEAEVVEARRWLSEDFETVEHTGPRRAAEFIHRGANDEAQAEAWAAVQDLLERLTD
jgi:hypothetical protein